MSEKSFTTVTGKTTSACEVKFRSDHFHFKRGVRLINKLLAPKYSNYKADADQLIDKALSKSNLSDFGSDFWKTPMYQSVKDINAHTNFHPLGAMLYECKVIQNLENRLWSQYWLNTDSSIDQPLPPIVMITGLQRTGTTFLQRLLGSMPEFRGVKSWEIINPVPTSKKKTYHGHLFARFGLKALNYINPEFQAIHAINYDSLDEEVVLMEHCFMSTVLEGAMSVPNFALWLQEQDQRPAYEDLKMWLQFLVWRKAPQDILLLKSPHHLEFLDDYMHVFPNSLVVNMHRDPVDTMGSYCSMMHYAKKMFQPSSDPHEIGQHWLKKNKRLLTNSLEYKRKHPDHFMDIAYKDFVADPINTIRMIYAEVGLKWTPEHYKMAADYCTQHRKHKHGKHTYDLTDYGLSPEIIESEYSFYIDEYKAYL